MVAKGKPSINEALGIPSEYMVAKSGRHGDYNVAYLTREVRERECLVCGGKAHVKGRRWRKVWHAPVHRFPLMLTLQVTRMACTECGKTWNEKHDLIGDASIHMSVDVQDAIMIDLANKESVRATSLKNGPSLYLVNKVLDRAILESAWLPHTLCIDEFKANTDEGKMAVVISDGDAGLVVDILPRLTSKCIAEWFEGFEPKERQDVRFWRCDMSPLLIRAQKTHCPNAVLCIDHFHVVKLITDVFGEVRRRVQKDEGLSASLRKEMRRAWKLFLLKEEELEQIDFEYAEKLAIQRATLLSTFDLTEEELADMAHLKPREARAEKVKRLLEADPDLKASWHLMRLFRDWSDMPWCAEKREGLAKRISLAQKSGVPDMKRAAKTLKRNREGILNGYKHNKTNATAKGLNNFIKAMKRTSYGFKTFSRMRRRCFFSLSYMKVIKRGMKINGVEAEPPKS